jgi:hypothetical protein
MAAGFVLANTSDADGPAETATRSRITGPL